MQKAARNHDRKKSDTKYRWPRTSKEFYSTQGSIAYVANKYKTRVRHKALGDVKQFFERCNLVAKPLRGIKFYLNIRLRNYRKLRERAWRQKRWKLIAEALAATGRRD